MSDMSQPTLRICLVSAAVASGLSWLINRTGITFTPDSWSYWEGSVSLLAGDGYVYFGGQPIVSFAPLFSCVLAAAQAIGGVSGNTLIWFTVGMAAITAVVWTGFLRKSFPRESAGQLCVWLAAAYLALFIGTHYTSLFADTMLLPLLGLGLGFTLSATRAAGPHYALLIGGLIATLSVALLLKNSTVAFLPAFMAMLLAAEKPLRVRLISAASVAAAAVPWIAVRLLLGQGGSHPTSAGGVYTPSEYAGQLVSDVANRFGPLSFGFGYALLAIAVGVVIYGLQPRFRNLPWHQPLVLTSLFAVVSSLTLFALFNATTAIHDRLGGRFLWHVPLAIVIAVAIVGSNATSRTVQRTCIALLAVVVTLQAARSGRYAWERNTTPAEGVITAEMALSPSHVPGPDIIRDGKTVIAPPDFPWVDRSYRRLHAGEGEQSRVP